jgi:hypothetical protein
MIFWFLDPKRTIYTSPDLAESLVVMLPKDWRMYHGIHDTLRTAVRVEPLPPGTRPHDSEVDLYYLTDRTNANWFARKGRHSLYFKVELDDRGRYHFVCAGKLVTRMSLMLAETFNFSRRKVRGPALNRFERILTLR